MHSCLSAGYVGVGLTRFDQSHREMAIHLLNLHRSAKPFSFDSKRGLGLLIGAGVLRCLTHSARSQALVYCLSSQMRTRTSHLGHHSDYYFKVPRSSTSSRRTSFGLKAERFNFDSHAGCSVLTHYFCHYRIYRATPRRLLVNPHINGATSGNSRATMTSSSISNPQLSPITNKC